MTTEQDELFADARAARLLQHLPATPPAACERVHARLTSTLSQDPGGSYGVGGARARGLLAVGATVGLLAAGFLLVTRAVDKPVPSEPVALAGTLEAADGWGTDTSIPNVALSFDGSGTIEGTAGAPRIRWDSGLLNVEVTPDKGVRLAVTTRDAEVRVVGTRFSVSRDMLGTRIDVMHGQVQVDCGTDATRALSAGHNLLCLPQSAAGLLGRARALQVSNAPAADALDALDRGLAIVGPQKAVRDELTVRRIRALFDLARHGEVIDAARTYITSGGGGRRFDVEQIAAASAAVLGGCAVAAPWLLESDAHVCDAQ